MTMIRKRMHLNRVIMKSDTDVEDTEEARSEKTVIARKNLKDKIIRIYDRAGGGGSQMMNSLEDCLPQPIVDTNPLVNRPETEFYFFQLFFNG
ncbi:hypothetical protein JTB14_016481 [Gonioctena quinquepunctata]|nr:hypothetical protein JTB14_016481 [Gonioctena quinquepunctata]